MTLRPCPRCRRHVRDEACPFCGADVAPRSPHPVLVGRLSRAVVFAGATLAGCANPPPPQHASPPPPPPDEHQVQHVQQREPDPPPPPPGDGGFAKPPVVGTAKITGVVKTVAGAPLAWVRVTLSGNGAHKQAATDGAGRFEFRDLQAGDYTIRFQQESNHPRRRPPPGPVKQVTVTDGATEQVNVAMAPYVAPVDHGPCCKPYGAPPARRRVV